MGSRGDVSVWGDESSRPFAPNNARFARRVYGVVRDRSNASLRILDAGAIVAAWLVGYIAGFEGGIRLGIRGLLPYLLIPLAIQLIVNQVAGLYGPVWRYASVEEGARVVVAVAAGTIASTLAIGWTADVRSTHLPLLAAPPTAALLMLLGCGGFRFQARLFALERQQDRANRLRTLIVGAGAEGVALSRELTQRPSSSATAVGFIDNDARLINRSVRGLPVFGSIEDLERVCSEQRIDRIVIALPNTAREQVREVVTRSLRTDAQVKMLSDASAPDGEPLVANLRNLDPADLLGREPELVDSEAIGAYLENATVLVTGAGGSIGSEIAQQVLVYGPRHVLCLDRDESLLFETMATIDDERAQPLLADIRDDMRLRDIFDRYRPDVVFHAAAHKHVPILEAHPAEAVETNLLATWLLAELAAKYGSRFIQISTDKAAAPLSVMGATKRAAEQVVLAVGRQNGLPFSAVRFGNVLGSRGSVVPTFFRQILEGGPLTVTDPEMTRYFMTIPEAVRLVLQAGAMAEERKLFLLDMGEPVRILDLARQMVRMAGLRPGRDIDIRVVGARPGERLHEQLYDESESLTPTWHPSIRSVRSEVVPTNESLISNLETMRVRCLDADATEVRQMLRDILAICGVRFEGTLRGGETPAHEVSAGGHPRRHLVDIDLTTTDRHRARTFARPAIIGGEPAFDPGLPFARPTRPPLEDVTRLFEPSYDAGILTNGPLVKELEAHLANRLGVRFAIAVSSCTSGLMLVVRALIEGRDGPVVVPSFTFSATAHAVAWNGRTPEFVDCNRRSLQIELAHAATAVDGASALLATHVFGAPCEPAAVAAIARAQGVPVVFDAAHALGARSEGKPVGSFGNAEVFSLTPTKPLVAGEGGIVTTNDDSLAEAVRIGRDYGNPGDYDTQFAGLNARMSEFHAATALAGLPMFDEALARRRAIADLYRRELSDIPGVSFQDVPPDDVSTYKDFVVLIDAKEFGLRRDLVTEALARDGIDTRKYFDPPVHRQHAYAYVPHGDLPATEDTAERVIALPMFTDLTDRDVERVAAVVASIQDHAPIIKSRFERRGEPSRGARLGRSIGATSP